MARGWKHLETVHRDVRVPFGSKNVISSKSSSGRSLIVGMVQLERYKLPDHQKGRYALFVSVEI
jgi:hypothetical protein